MKLNEQINRMKTLMGIKESIVPEPVLSDALREYFMDSDTMDERTNPDAVEGSTFSIEALSEIPNFKDRVAYCNKTLKFLGQGSSRRVYELPDGIKVLKLAKNKKGIAQNEAEYDLGNLGTSIIAEVFYEDMVDDNIVFVVMEKAERIKEGDFQALTDIPFQKFGDICYYSKRDFQFVDNLYALLKKLNLDTERSMDFANDMNDYVMGSGLNKFGDLAAITSYGKVLRDGEPTLVLVDYGLTDEVGANYYGM